MAIHLINSTLTLNTYLDIDVKDDRFDEIETNKVVMDVVFSVSVDSIGLTYNVHKISNIGYNYTGIVYNEDKEEMPQEIDETVTDVWTKNINLNKSDSESTQIALNEVEIDVDNKIITINFIY